MVEQVQAASGFIDSAPVPGACQQDLGLTIPQSVLARAEEVLTSLWTWG